jgi:hypothetical protein
VTLKDHKKHAAIARPANGNFGRNEWAIVGGTCTAIKLLADRIITALSAEYQCAYADTSHNDDMVQPPGRLTAGAVIEYTDQIKFSQLNYQTPLTLFKQRELFAATDLVLVNGNHQQAKAQVVIVDAYKHNSLQKRVSQLKNVQMILLADNAQEPFDCLVRNGDPIHSYPVKRGQIAVCCYVFCQYTVQCFFKRQSFVTNVFYLLEYYFLGLFYRCHILNILPPYGGHRLVKIRVFFTFLLCCPAIFFPAVKSYT